MSQANQHTPWSLDAYLDWEARQPIRYELADGQVYAMAGGTADHDTIGNNLRGELHSQLRGTPCRVQGPDLKVRAGHDVRYPAAMIDCGARSPGMILAPQPVAVFDVLSKRTAWIDQGLKLRAYNATPSIRTYVLISQDEMRAMVYLRDQAGTLGIQSALLFEGPDAVIELPEHGVVLRFADLYEGVDIAAAAG